MGTPLKIEAMRHISSILLTPCVLLLSAGAVLAHGGLENETEIRVRKDRIEITVRSSLLFVWKLLGDRAPADAGEASLEKIKPILKEIAPGLVEMTSVGAPLKLRSADCAFELEEHAAFILVYEMPPAEAEIQFKASFFKKLGGLEEGSFRLVDLTGAATRRDVEPLARKRLHRVDDAFIFTPTKDGVKVAVEKPRPSPAPAETPGK